MPDKEINSEQLELEEQTRRLTAERDEYLNGWKRAKADLINYQKEEAGRVEEAVKFGNVELIKEIISVIASFELALSELEKVGSVDKGLYMIKSQLEDILKRNGVERINAYPGEIFNPRFHEAIGVIESASPADRPASPADRPASPADKPPDGLVESGQIAEEVDGGYTMHNKVIKVAKVRVIE